MRFFVVEVCLGLEEFHKKDIIYKDLIPENVLINEKGHVFLTDFGNARFDLKSNENSMSSSIITCYTGILRHSSHIMLIVSLCNCETAPEVLLGGKYSRSSDYWSLGIFVYELLTGMPPFYSEHVEL